MERFVTRGFRGRRSQAVQGLEGRLPPGQHPVEDFPVLSAGPTPRTDLATWDLTVDGLVARPGQWSWQAFQALPRETPTVDIHCVTTWSKFDTTWEGVSVDHLLGLVSPTVEGARAYLVAHCDGGYTTNLPLADVTSGRAWVAFGFGGQPLATEHGGPARLLVPHLYLWKSAKWLRRLEIVSEDRPGFWETLGYHDRGDPWREQRYQGD